MRRRKMSSLGLAPGLRCRQFDGETGAVIFNPGSADTHLLGEGGLQLLQWRGQLPHSIDRELAMTGLLANGAADEIAVADVQALNTLLDELLQSGLLVESAP